jgi:hypothetical protein
MGSLISYENSVLSIGKEGVRKTLERGWGGESYPLVNVCCGNQQLKQEGRKRGKKGGRGGVRREEEG